MKPFFIPNIDQTEWNDFYLLILERYKKDYLISSKKIRGISYYFRSEYRSLFVGKELPGTEQVIYIILFDEIKKMYMVFAPDHGLYRGSPFTINHYTAHQIKEYLFN